MSYNHVADIGSLEILASCPRLHSLSLAQNPLWTLSTYRRVVGSTIPQLHVLDGRRLSMDDKAAMVRTHILLTYPDGSGARANGKGGKSDREVMSRWVMQADEAITEAIQALKHFDLSR